MDAPCKNYDALRCQKDSKFFTDLLKDIITKTMEARERAMFYLDYYRVEIMDYNRPAGSDDDGPLTSDYNPDSAHRNVELTS
ncbi:hypothetical protein D1007_61476 [Hordeum vulgare]|nr:hypothetical protein D1007_61476 [Hordeum vulgare]